MRGYAAIAKSGLMVTWLLISVWPAPAAIAGNGFPQPFDAGVSYVRELFVDASAQPGGDGSRNAPLRDIAAALERATPGTRVRGYASRRARTAPWGRS